MGDVSKAATPSRTDLWKASIKVPMYTVAITPIAVGSAAAFADSGVFYPGKFVLFLTAAVLIIAWLNCTNDVFDFDTGIDVNKRESIVNLCGATRAARNSVLAVASCFLLAGFAALYALSVFPTFDATVLALLGVSVFGGYAYQGPPFRLGYFGLGEPICFATWFLSTIAAYYSQMHPILSGQSNREDRASLDALGKSMALVVSWVARPGHFNVAVASFLVALPTAIILFCSHFHQIVDDKAAGKLSPVVRLGTYRAARVLRFALACMYFCQILAYFTSILPLIPTILACATTPHAYRLASFVSTYHAKPERVRVAKYHAVRLHFVHGMALTLGYCIDGWIKRRAM